MKLLVLFTDEVFSICEPRDVTIFKRKCPAVKYTDGKKYTARILALHEDEAILEKIQRNLEETENCVPLASISVTQDKLSYSDVLKKHAECHDPSKLYLDPIAIPTRIDVSESYVFSLRGQEETKNFFKTQPDFVTCDIIRPETGTNEMHRAFQHPDIKGSRDRQTVEQPSNQMDRSVNMILQELETSENGINEKNLGTPIIKKTDAKEHILGNQILVSNEIIAQVSNKEVVMEKNVITDVSENRNVEGNSITETHLSENETDIEKCLTKHRSAIEICSETNTTEPKTQERNDDDKSTELIPIASIPDEEGLEIIPKILMPADKGTEVTSKASKSNEKSTECTVKALIPDRMVTTTTSVAPIFEGEATNLISEPSILVEKGTTLILEAPILQNENSIINEKKTDDQRLKLEFCDTKNTNEPFSNHQIVDKHSNETIPENLNLGKISSVDQKSDGSKNHVKAEQTAERLEKVEDNGVIHNAFPNQTEPKTGKLDANSCLDENLNCSAMSDLNNTIDINVQSNKLKIESDIKGILHENDTTVYIAKTMSSLYDLNCQGNLNIEELHVEANVLDTDKVLNPDATYSLDLFGLELSSDCNNLLNTSEETAEAGSTSQALLNILRGNVYHTNENPKKTPETSLILPDPIGSSTVMEFSEPSSTADADNDEDSKSSHEPDGEDYIPSSADSSTSDADSAADELPEKSVGRKERQKKNNSSLNITLGENKPGMSAPDDAGLTVSTSNNAAETKKYFCVYCQKFQSKLARHLELVHDDKEEVKQFMKLPVKNRERLQLIAAIRNNGSHLYNTDKRFNKGDLLVVRRPQARMKKGAKDFLACGNCHGQYSRAVIRHHFKRCTKKSSTKERLVIVKGRKVSGRVHEIANVLVRKYIFPYLREDDVVRTIRYDKLITLYANKQCEKYGSHQHLYQMIRQRIRLLGRLFLAIKSLNSSIKTFSDIFQPRHYDDSVKAVRIVAGFDEIARTFAHPSVASNLGTMLKYVGEILRSEYIKEERTHDQKRVDDFLKLLSEDYGTSVNRAVLETQLQNNRRKKEVLPNLDDITKLHNFLKAERETYFGRLNNELSPESWQKLAEVTLISLQLFNRRRAGEIERVYLEDFDSYHGIDEVADKETYASLSKQGQALARKYVRFMIRGKLGRGVPVLVPSNLLDSLLLIRQYRRDVGVPEANPYLFGVPSKDRDRFKYLRACDLLRKFSQHCGAEVPSTLRGTKLRKHVATKCISLNLSENQVSDLANFMGHADKIHKEIYRQPIIQNDIIKISQLLEMAQGTQDSSPNDEDSSSDEEENVRSAVEAEHTSSADFEGNENPADSDAECSTKSKRMSNVNKSRTSNSASRVGTTHRRWTELERNTVLGAFNETIRTGKMPSGEQMQKLIDANDCLKGREVAQLRTWLHTQKKKICKN